MRKNHWKLLALLFILPAMFLSVSCAKKAVEAEPAVTQAPAPTPAPAPAPAPAAPAEPAKPAVDEKAMAAVAAREAALNARNKFINEAVYFEFDSSTLLPAAQQIIKGKADYMMQNANVNVTIEGHCDERGTAAYNMALGQRRADAVRDYLINLGISGARLGTISYGEERPVDYGQNEEAWAKNRRAQFGIK